jgi:rhamnogalacturonyl hydrolase YesR
MAYPLAQIAIVRNDRKLAGIALDQLVHRIHYLSTSEAVFQRNDLGKGTGFRNWGRGIVWYVLGMVKTINLMENSAFADLPQLDGIKTEFVRVMNWASQFQDKNGMWCSFIHRPDTLPDTTATAGIATTMVWGVRLKLLPESYLAKAELAGVSLRKYLTADGFLTNVSQINRGGESLQENGYRAISQFALGLMVQYFTVIDLG